MSGSIHSYSVIFPGHQLISRLQHVSAASDPTQKALNTDKGAPPPMARQRTVINEATPEQSGSVIPHLQSVSASASKSVNK